MKKEKKQKYVDDGHTIYDMNVDAKWNNHRKVKDNSIPVEKGERWLLIKAAFRAYIPKLLMVLFCFAIAILLIYLWLA